MEPHERRKRKVKFTEDIGKFPKQNAQVIPPTEAEEEIVEPSVFNDVCSRTDPLRTKDGEALKVPSLEDIREAQRQSRDDIPKKSKLNDNGMRIVDGRIWVPSELAPILVAVTHGTNAHPGVNAAAELLKRYFWIENLWKLAKALNKYCLVCYGEHLPRTFKRKMGQQIYGTKRNAVLHLDFLYVKKAEYVLSVRDDLSGKTEWFFSTTADAIVAGDAILWWRARYGLRSDTVIVTDGGSHFANSLIKELIARLRIRHHITVVYAPWSNGKAERVNREFLKTLRILLAADGRDHKAPWRDFLPSLQYHLNNTPRKRLAGRTADEVFLLMAP